MRIAICLGLFFLLLKFTISVVFAIFGGHGGTAIQIVVSYLLVLTNILLIFPFLISISGKSDDWIARLNKYRIKYTVIIWRAITVLSYIISLYELFIINFVWLLIAFDVHQQ